jgi:hypothetical protein
VVAIGSWNVPIFTTGWIRDRLQVQLDGEVALIATADGFALRGLIDEKVELLITSNKLQARPLQADDGTFGHVELVVRRLLDKLPETPVQAVGVNVAYDVAAAERSIGDVLVPSDSDALRSVGTEIQMTGVQRRLKYDTWILNLTIEQESAGKINLHLNYHFDINPPSASSASGVLSDKVIALRKESERFIRSVYKVEG